MNSDVTCRSRHILSNPRNHVAIDSRVYVRLLQEIGNLSKDNMCFLYRRYRSTSANMPQKEEAETKLMLYELLNSVRDCVIREDRLRSVHFANVTQQHKTEAVSCEIPLIKQESSLAKKNSFRALRKNHSIELLDVTN